jgi:hypothetical protein
MTLDDLRDAVSGSTVAIRGKAVLQLAGGPGDKVFPPSQPERIYLFGSKARGDARPDSDYDLLLVVPDDALPERRDSKLAYRALWEIGAASDVIVWERSRFERRSRVVCSLPAKYCARGVFSMPHDPELVAETRDWLQRAAHDLGAGRVDLGVESPFTEDAVFHAQQAAEKSMKAFLTWRSQTFGKTHNLTDLGTLRRSR